MPSARLPCLLFDYWNLELARPVKQIEDFMRGMV